MKNVVFLMTFPAGTAIADYMTPSTKNYLSSAKNTSILKIENTLDDSRALVFCGDDAQAVLTAFLHANPKIVAGIQSSPPRLC